MGEIDIFHRAGFWGSTGNESEAWISKSLINILKIEISDVDPHLLYTDPDPDPGQQKHQIF